MMDDLSTRSFWKAAGIRALWTFVQTFLAIFGVGAGTTIFDASVVGMLVTSLTAAVLSIGKSVVAGIPEVPQS